VAEVVRVQAVLATGEALAVAAMGVFPVGMSMEHNASW
jgi:hypothetical protein